MDDQLWQELLESPYEKKRKPKEAPSGPQRPLIGLTVGIAVAVVVGGGAGWWLAPEAAEVTAPTTTVTAPPTTQPAAIGEPGFLPGFSELGGTAFAPVVQFTVGDKTYIAVSEIVHSDSDRAATQPTAIVVIRCTFLRPQQTKVLSTVHLITAHCRPAPPSRYGLVRYS